MMDFDESLEFQELLTQYKKAKEKGKPCYMDSDDYIDIAEYYISHGDVQEAYEVVERGLSFHRANPDLLSLRANTLIGLNRFEEAEDAVAMLNADDDHDVYYFNAQLACAKEHDNAKAEKLFKKWLKIETGECREMSDNEEASTRQREAYMHIIMSLSDLTDEGEAQQLLPAWVDRYIKHCSPIPGDDIDLDIARMCNINQLYEKEIELYNHILDSNPYLPQGWTYLASLQVLCGDIEGSLNSVDFALAIDPEDTQALLVKGQDNMLLSNFAEAEKALTKYVHLSHDDYYNIALANCMMMQGKKEAARQLLDENRLHVVRSMEERSAKADMWAYISEIYRSGGYYTEAMRAISYALRLYPDSPAYKMMKGSVYLDQEKIGKAVMCFIEGAAGDPSPVKALLTAATECLGHGHYIPAMMFLKMVTKEPDDPDSVKAYPYLAYCYFLLKMPRFFYENLELACRNTPDVVADLWKDDLMGIEPKDYYYALKTLYGDFGLKEKLKDIDIPNRMLDIDQDVEPF